jgi:drug/metabolite transporter (DMT)-like permease
MTPSRIGVVVLGFVGALIILRPGLIAFQPASLLVLSAALGYAIFNALTKTLTATEKTFGIVFWMNAMQLPMGLAGSDPSFSSSSVGRRSLRSSASVSPVCPHIIASRMPSAPATPPSSCRSISCGFR